jgi:uncharacterized protein involved in exopolysaccharide biosynthesis
MITFDTKKQIIMNIFDEKTNLGPVAKMYLKNWKKIVVAVIGSVILAGALSFLLTPRYQARTSFFIPYNTSYDQTVDNPQFGFDVEADRLLQILNSDQLKDSITLKFDMANYFKIDTAESDWRDKLSKKYEKYISAGRTNAMSIVITVQYVLDLSQRMRERMLKTNSEVVAKSFENNYLAKLAEVDSLRSKIIQLRKSASGNTVALMNAQILWEKGNSNNVSPEIAVEIETLSQKYIFENKRLDELKGKYENAKIILERPIPKFYMLDKPTSYYTKTFPLIGFNITVAFLGSLVLMLVGLYLKHVVNTVKKEISNK